MFHRICRSMLFLGLGLASTAAQAQSTFWSRAGAYVPIEGDNSLCDSDEVSSGTARCAAAVTVGNPGDLFYFGGEGSSTASLAAGVLEVHALSFGGKIGSATFPPAGEATGTARVLDTLTFAGSFAPDATVTISLSANFTYTEYQPGPPGTEFGIGTAFMEMEGTRTGDAVLARAFHCTPGESIVCRNPNFGDYVLETDGSLYTIRESFRLADLSGGSLRLLLYLGAKSRGTGSASATDSSIAVTLPTGVTFASTSGVFLTEVPEPGAASLATWALLSLGAVRSTRRADPCQRESGALG